MRWKLFYWTCQITGWLLFILLNLFFFQLDQDISSNLLLSLGFTFFYGILSSHLYRLLILRNKLLRLPPVPLVILFLFSSLILGVSFHFFHRLFLSLISGLPLEGFFGLEELPDIINISLVYLVWNLIYFLVHFVKNYKKEEIKNLRFEAARSEMEYNTLKSQLNPHFLFNALNSIRALIDENPESARAAVTGLASILRTSLLLGKRKMIPFREELQLVKDYLALEKIRYEERLKIDYQIPEGCENFQIPPMMVQTLVENAVKHGISKLPKGGEICLECNVTDERLKIIIRNTGTFENGFSETAVGLNNIRQRLNLLYGKEASFELDSDDQNVIAKLVIPYKDESDSN